MTTTNYPDPRDLLLLARRITATVMRRWGGWLRGHRDEVESEALVAVVEAEGKNRLWVGSAEHRKARLWLTAYHHLLRGLRGQRYLPPLNGWTGLGNRKYLAVYGTPESQLRPTGNDDGIPPVTACAPAPGQDQAEFDARDLVGTLADARLEDMVWRHYVDGETLDAVGRRWGVTRQRASQLVTGGLAQLRGTLRRGGCDAA